MQLFIMVMVLAAGSLAAWMALAHLGIVPPPHWNGAAAWAALRGGLPGLNAQSGSPRTPSAPTAHSSHPIPVPGSTVSRRSWDLPGPWMSIVGLIIGLLLAIWIIWGTLVWIYNTPPMARRWMIWRDWILWRWPVITWSYWAHQPTWITDAWTRHKRLWAISQMTSSTSMHDPQLAQAATILGQGFEMSHRDLVWVIQADGTALRRMLIVADADSIHPQWPQGLHAETMIAWVQWATQWAEIALHHAGIDGHWTVNSEGMVRPASASSSIPDADMNAVPDVATRTAHKASSTKTGELMPKTQWSASGLTWGEIHTLAPEPWPELTESLPSQRIDEVLQVLMQLGIPDVEPVGGLRGLAIDVIEVRPVPALASRLLTTNMATALAGQLGHGDIPLRMHYVDGKPGIIAIERPRPDRQFVDLMTALVRTPARNRQTLRRMALPVCLGVTPDGQVFWADAATWPHVLIGGATGGGKTTAITGWLATLFITMPPSLLRITLVDPKAGSQFPWASQMPHVDQILTQATDLVTLVAEWADEQDARYAQFAQWGVMDLYGAQQQGHYDFPFRLLVVDEYKDIKDQLDKETLKDLERNIGRIGQKARGAGMFLWIATQHPLAETISSTLKANLPARVALRVAASTASQVILDEPGAEALLGKGDAFFRDSTSPNLIRMQTPSALNDQLWPTIRAAWEARSF